MGKVYVSTYVSLDGVVEEPQHWSLNYFNDEAMELASSQLFGCEALLMGRNTYEGFASSWPERGGDFADRINTMPKYVVSSKLTDPEWANTTVLSGDPAEAVAKLKQDVDGDIVIYGSGDLVDALLANDLVDEYRLWFHPVVVGSGRRLFETVSEQKTLAASEPRTFSSGVTVLSLRPAS